VSEVFTTERLIVRPWEQGDAARHFDMYSRPEVMRWLGSTPRTLEQPDESVEFIKRYATRDSAGGRFGIWAVELRDTGVVAGTVLLAPIKLTGEETARLPEDGGDVEVGWHFHPDSWGHGYATEAARGALAKGFAAGLDEVVAVVRPDNAASLAVCRRLGMEELGRTTKWYGLELESFRISRPR
jgi:RimJ/RimL family protein N-acetyltransferase